jgi:hypothetical protein
MINLRVLMKVINERHAFINNHVEAYLFLKDILGKDVEEGAIITIKINTPNGEVSTMEIEIQESDMPFLMNLAELLSLNNTWQNESEASHKSETRKYENKQRIQIRE